MHLTSPAFKHNGLIPTKFTCDGQDVSPELIFSEIPKEARSLALICQDPDAPRAEGWTHWLLGNIHPMTTKIRENEPPDSGLQLTNDFGKLAYGGPCPPKGMHRYFFQLFALEVELKLEATMGKKELEAAMKGHILEKTELIGLYQRYQ